MDELILRCDAIEYPHKIIMPPPTYPKTLSAKLYSRNELKILLERSAELLDQLPPSEGFNPQAVYESLSMRFSMFTPFIVSVDMLLKRLVHTFLYYELNLARSPLWAARFILEENRILEFKESVLTGEALEEPDAVMDSLEHLVKIFVAEDLATFSMIAGYSRDELDNLLLECRIHSMFTAD